MSDQAEVKQPAPQPYSSRILSPESEEYLEQMLPRNFIFDPLDPRSVAAAVEYCANNPRRKHAKKS
jgi:hypothetical protein